MNRLKISKSISSKIFVYMLLFSVLIISIIGVSIKFILPTYYYNQQVAYLESSESQLRDDYKNGDSELAIITMEKMEAELGGELYYYNENLGQQSYGMGKGKNRVENANSEKFIPSGDISAYTYKNKIGLDIYVVGILIDDNYLVYEVDIQSLNRVVDTMMNFVVVLLGIVLIMAGLVSFVLANTISKPIRELNVLAESMKAKTIEPSMVVNGSDEIAELNRTLNGLYEELQGKIFKLNTELHKERNSEKLKKRFLAQATHELKTPIAIIRGYAEILYDGMYKDEEERDRFLKHIYDETESVSHLILDVLDYTKMETGNYQLRMEQVLMNQYVQVLEERFTDYIDSFDLISSFKVDIQKDFYMEIDKERMDQVYKNLLSNAVEHAKTKVVTKVTTFGDKFRISVFNDGPNINEEDLPNVFESFYKAAGKDKGTGLGLAIVKEIIILHGGEYRVKNHEKGVEFIVTI